LAQALHFDRVLDLRNICHPDQPSAARTSTAIANRPWFAALLDVVAAGAASPDEIDKNSPSRRDDTMTYSNQRAN
jgi:hypothetical protein